MLLRTAIAIGAVLALATSCAVAIASDAPVNFARDVKPLLARRCFSCHGPNTQEGGLRLDNAEAALAELDSGLHAIVPSNVDESALIARVTATDEAERMPPEGKPLTPSEVATLRKWIAAGAKYEKHWAFVPPERHAAPEVANKGWLRNPIDAFILANLEQAGFEPAEPADKRTLARRAYFGVVGLPPTNAQLQAFLADDTPGAWPRLVDSLLASPHFGEHWARHWLDLVRFAETNSFERDGLKPNAWKYRDYVIRSFNDDKPYDQFVKEQLAGDELDEVTADTMIATGYYRLGTWDDEPADPLQAKYDDYDDIISTTSQAFLGLTVGCARCHDHKIDPIPQTDYYGLLAFFADVTPYADVSERDPGRFSQWDMSKPEERARRAALQEKADQIAKEMQAIEEVGVSRMTPGEREIARTPDRGRLLQEKLERFLNVSEWSQYQETSKRLAATREELKKLPPLESALSLAKCNPRPEATHLMLRGQPTRAGRHGGAPLPCPVRRSAADDSGGRRNGPFRGSPSRAGRVDHIARQHADRPRDREPRVAALLWPRPCANGEQLRRTGHAVDAPGVARLPGSVARRS